MILGSYSRDSLGLGLDFKSGLLEKTRNGYEKRGGYLNFVSIDAMAIEC